MSSVQLAGESARGSLILFIGNLLATAIGAVSAVIVARLLGPSGYGVYTLAFVVPSILQIFVGFGVNYSITRYAAYYVSKGELDRAVRMTRHAVVFLLLFGAALTIVSLFAGPLLAAILLKRTGLTPFVQVASLMIFGSTLTQAAFAGFIGWNSMKEVSLFSILQAGIKLGVAPALILLGFGVFGAVVGQVSSFVVGGGVAAVVLYALKIRSAGGEEVAMWPDVKEMMAYGLPLFAGGIVAGLAAQYLTVVLATIASNEVIGFYQAAVNVTVAIGVISGAIGNVLFRSFAALDGLRGDLSRAFGYAVKYVSYLLTPVAFFLVASADVLFGVLYGPFYSSGVILLRLLAVSYLPVAIGLTVIPSFLSGVGKSRLSMLTSIMGAIALVAAGPVLAISLGLGVEGIIYATLLSNVVTSAAGIIVSVKYLGVRLEPVPLGGILMAGGLASLSVYLIPQSDLPYSVLLVLDLAVFIIVYLTGAPLLRGIDSADLARLEEASENMGVVKRAIRLVLRYEKQMLVLAQRVRP